jgi:predicted nucleic-acid-binding Zn-ribbon protein
VLIDACGEITGIKPDAPPPVSYATDLPPSLTARANGAVYGAYTCARCGNTGAESTQISTTGGWISRFFNFQANKFIALSCTACGYSELYKRRAGFGENLLDILNTG